MFNQQNMKIKNLTLMSLINAAAVFVYVFFLVMLMNSMQYLFAEPNEVAMGMIMIILFLVSACITGALVLGKPVLMYLDKKRNEAVKMFLMTVGWLVVFLVVTVTVWALV